MEISRTYDIIGGPNRETIIDAFKYNRDKIIIPIEFLGSVDDVTKFEVTASIDEGATEIYPLTNNMVSGKPNPIKENTINQGVYYYKLSSEGTENLVFTYKGSSNISFKVKNLFSYKYEDNNVQYDKEIPEIYIEKKVAEWDNNNQFDYTYTPSNDANIYDPLNPKAYFTPSHICNKFTIPYISSINVRTMNKRS